MVMASKSNHVFAVDLGGTHLRTAAIDENGNIHHRTKFSTPDTSRPDDIVRAIVNAARARELEVASTCVAVPGTVGVEMGIVMSIPNLPSLAGFNLAKAVHRELNHSVVIKHDAKAAAMEEIGKRGSRDNS